MAMFQPDRRRCLIALGLVGAVGYAYAHAAPSLEERKKHIKAMEQQVSSEALQRRSRSEAVLKSEGVPINWYLPVIEDEKEARRRSKEEIARRSLCLLVIAAKGEGVEQPILERLASEYGLAGQFTPKERAFFADRTPSQHDKVQFGWRYEAAWILLWALGYVESLSKPTAICDVPRADRTMRERTAKSFIADSKLRNIGEILDQADLIYRYHWATVDAGLNEKPAPAALNPDVVQERHHALNWLIGYMGQEWDDISTDT